MNRVHHHTHHNGTLLCKLLTTPDCMLCAVGLFVPCSVHVPAVYPQLTSARVLTMEFIEGVQVSRKLQSQSFIKPAITCKIFVTWDGASSKPVSATTGLVGALSVITGNSP